MSCNGWANYATWRVNLEIITDYVDSLAADDTGIWADIAECADYLETHVDECLTEFGNIPDDSNSIALSYARAFVSEVDYREIAEHIAQDYPSLFATDDEPGG